MKFLVTGGSGFIGHNIVAALEKQGHEVLVIDNYDTYGIIPTEEISHLHNARRKKFSAEVANIDIRNLDQCKEAFTQFLPDVVIHLASLPRQKVVNANPHLGAEVMVSGLINLLECAKTTGVKRFVYVSSSMVYGDFTAGATEDAICNPSNLYGILKLSGEKITLQYTKDMETVIIRPSAVYGPYDVEDRVVSKFILAAMRGETLKVNGPDEQLDFTYVDDAAQGIALASVYGKPGKIYNITRGESRTLLEAAELAIKIVGNGSIESRDRDPNFPKRSALSISAAQLDLNYRPSYNIEEGFKLYYEWLNQDPFFQSRASIRKSA